MLITKIFTNIFGSNLLGIAFLIFVFEFFRNLIFTFTKRKNKKNIDIEKKVLEIKSNTELEYQEKKEKIKNLTNNYNGQLYFMIVLITIVLGVLFYIDVYSFISISKLKVLDSNNRISIFGIYILILILRLFYNYKLNKGYKIKKMDIISIIINIITVFLFIMYDKTMAIPTIIMCSYTSSFISNIIIDIFDILRRKKYEE